MTFQEQMNTSTNFKREHICTKINQNYVGLILHRIQFCLALCAQSFLLKRWKKYTFALFYSLAKQRKRRRRIKRKQFSLCEIRNPRYSWIRVNTLNWFFVLSLIQIFAHFNRIFGEVSLNLKTPFIVLL